MTTQALLQNVPTGLMFTEQISKEQARETIAKAVSYLNAIPIDSDHNVKLVTEKAKELSSSIKALDDLRKEMNAPDQARINERMEAFRYISFLRSSSALMLDDSSFAFSVTNLTLWSLSIGMALRSLTALAMVSLACSLEICSVNIRPVGAFCNNACVVIICVIECL